MANYLITGGCGFIGSHLAESILGNGFNVRVLDNLSTGKRSNLPDGCELVVGDITDAAMVRSCMEGVDGCFHLAAIASVQESIDNWASTHRTNLTGSINVFNASRERKTPVVYASSAAVYGDNADLPLKERSLVRPLTAYGADKLGSEQHARVASLVHGVPTTGLRFFNVYGPRQDPNSPYSGVISIFVDRALNGEAIKIFGDGQQTRDFVYVADVVHFLRSAMISNSCNPSIYNVCTGSYISVNQLAKMVGSIAGTHLPLLHEPSRRGDIRASIGDPSFSKSKLGLSSYYSLSAGLRLLIESERSKQEQELVMVSR
ncbi:MAG: NAD-dependent epimerase/dehydratase family protein [Cycloclasticus sp.]